MEEDASSADSGPDTLLQAGYAVQMLFSLDTNAYTHKYHVTFRICRMS